MSTPYLSEIKIVSFNFPPKGWAFCNGQLLSIQQNAALFALIGTFYGGNGTSTFALPNLQARTAVHMGNGFTIGELGGEATHTLITQEMPGHTHQASGSTAIASKTTPSGNEPAQASQNPYGSTPNSTMLPGAVSTVGGSQPHDNMPPYLTLSFIIALQGIFPSRS